MSVKYRKITAVLTLLCLGAACSDRGGDFSSNTPVTPLHISSALIPASEAATVQYRTIEWVDLIPKQDLDVLMKPPEYLNEIEDNALEDRISNQIQMAISSAKDSEYQRALTSTRIKPEYNQQRIRIPGFIVPLTFDENNHVTTFFLVPFFGACIHQPPPPPNQIIYSTYLAGKKQGALYDPFWIEGTIQTTLVENDMATAAYSMQVDSIKPYTE